MLTKYKSKGVKTMADKTVNMENQEIVNLDTTPEQVFYEKYVDGIWYRGFYLEENREHIIGGVMSNVFELGKKIHERYIQEGKSIL